MRKNYCYSHHHYKGARRILREKAKSKVDKVHLRIGAGMADLLFMSAIWDYEYSSCHKSWKNQSKRKRQYK